MKAAIYLRVSTADQNNEHQRRELREYAERRGWEPVEFVDVESGAKMARAGLEELMKNVRLRRVKVVLAAKLDRLGRSLPHLAAMFGEFQSNGVALVVPSQGIDTSAENPASVLQMHILAAIAEFERSLIRERTRAGLATARALGKRLGRPPFEMTPARIEMLETWDGKDIRGLAKRLGCSVGKAHELTKQLEEIT